MSELKMSEFFDTPVKCIEDEWGSNYMIDAQGAAIGDMMTVDMDNAVAHAINNHDKLTQQNKEMISALSSVINCSKNNTGAEPSLSCFHRSIDEAETLLKEIKGES